LFEKEIILLLGCKSARWFKAVWRYPAA